MQKQLIITLFIGIAIGINTAPASAATKCVALNPEMVCDYSYGGALSVLSWSTRCSSGNGATKINISGVSGCSNQNTNASLKSENLTVDSISDNNIYCWCKMTSPAVSQWIYGHRWTQGECPHECAEECLGKLGDSIRTSFKTAMFSDLTD